MKGYLAKAIGHAQAPLGSRAGQLRGTARRVSRWPAAAPAPGLGQQTEQTRTPSIPEVPRERTVASRPPEEAQSAQLAQPAPQVYVQRIVTAGQPPAALPERVVSSVQIREKHRVEERTVVREVERRSELPREQMAPEDRVEVEEGSSLEMTPAPQPVAPARTDFTQIPVHVELPKASVPLPPEARREVERTVTRIVRERVRGVALPRTASPPEKLEVRIDQVTVRVENPPAPPPAPVASPAPGGFADYILARTVSR
ncbi:MAG: hypothetical protein J0H49_07960 [Acidobacteria bacterium]|nr:hypothetical protein [Acidobacteriota bacterium]